MKYINKYMECFTNIWKMVHIVSFKGIKNVLEKKKLHSPEGFTDYLPEANLLKEITEFNISEVFKRYGYKSISSPTLEYVEVFEGSGNAAKNDRYQFTNKSGDVLALRSDVTPPIVRIATRNYKGSDLPLRFSYIQNIFKDSTNYTGKLKEVTQAGVELIGNSSPEADAEVIAVAINSLLLAGVTDFQIDIGHVDFVGGFLAEEDFFDNDNFSTKYDINKDANFKEGIKEKIHKLLIKKDFATAVSIAKDFGVKEDVITALDEIALLSGNIEIIDKVRERLATFKTFKETTKNRILDVLSYLEQLYKIIEDYALSNYVVFDLSIAGDMDYYSGIIFKGYTKGVGFSLIDGGRYDHLSENFGKEFPAVGFAIKINNVLMATQSKLELSMKSADTLIAYDENHRQEAIITADELRSSGLLVENSFVTGGITENIEYAKSRGIDGLIYFADKITLVDIKTSEQKITTVDELTKNQGGE